MYPVSYLISSVSVGREIPGIPGVNNNRLVQYLRRDDSRIAFSFPGWSVETRKNGRRPGLRIQVPIWSVVPPRSPAAVTSKPVPVILFLHLPSPGELPARSPNQGIKKTRPGVLVEYKSRSWYIENQFKFISLCVLKYDNQWYKVIWFVSIDFIENWVETTHDDINLDIQYSPEWWMSRWFPGMMAFCKCRFG